MKSFIKKFSFVLAAAMVLTSVAVPASAKAATSGEATARYLKTDKSTATAVTSKTIYAGGKWVNFDYNYGGKTTGVKGTWKSSNSEVVAVDSNTGVAHALKKGDVTLTFTPAKATKYDAINVTVKARVRATGVVVRENDNHGNQVTEVEANTKDAKTFYVSMPTKTGVKASYFVHVEAPKTVSVSFKKADGTLTDATTFTKDTSRAGYNYGRTLVIKAATDDVTTAAVKIKVSASKDPANTSSYNKETTLNVKLNSEGKAVANDPYAIVGKVMQGGLNKIRVYGVAEADMGKLVVNNNAAIVKSAKFVPATGSATGVPYVELTTAKDLTPNAVYTVYLYDSKDANGKPVEYGHFTAQGTRLFKLVINDDLKMKRSNLKTAVGTVHVEDQFGNVLTNYHDLGENFDVDHNKGNATDAIHVVVNGFEATEKFDHGKPTGTWEYTVPNAYIGAKVLVHADAIFGLYAESADAYLTVKDEPFAQSKLEVLGLTNSTTLGTPMPVATTTVDATVAGKSKWYVAVKLDDYARVKDADSYLEATEIREYENKTYKNITYRFDGGLGTGDIIERTLNKADGSVGYIYFIPVETNNNQAVPHVKYINVTYRKYGEGQVSFAPIAYTVSEKNGAASIDDFAEDSILEGQTYTKYDFNGDTYADTLVALKNGVVVYDRWGVVDQNKTTADFFKVDFGTSKQIRTPLFASAQGQIVKTTSLLKGLTVYYTIITKDADGKGYLVYAYQESKDSNVFVEKAVEGSFDGDGVFTTSKNAKVKDSSTGLEELAKAEEKAGTLGKAEASIDKDLVGVKPEVVKKSIKLGESYVVARSESSVSAKDLAVVDTNGKTIAKVSFKSRTAGVVKSVKDINFVVEGAKVVYDEKGGASFKIDGVTYKVTFEDDDINHEDKITIQ